MRGPLGRRPFVWHIYPQEDGVHLEKLEAFLALPRWDGRPLSRLGTSTTGTLLRTALTAQAFQTCHAAHWPLAGGRSPRCVATALRTWRERLLTQADLCDTVEAVASILKPLYPARLPGEATRPATADRRRHAPFRPGD